MNLIDKLGIKSSRTKNISKHVLLSAIFKGSSILLSFLLVPLTINFLNPTNYGIWLVITSFISWFTFFDIGLGHGLRNKFATAKANGDFKLAKAYISSAYFSIAFISFSILLLFIIANLFIDWTIIFNTDKEMLQDLSSIMLLVFGNFCIQFILKLITTIYTADQRPSMQGLIGVSTQALSLLTIFLLSRYSSSSLLIFSVIFTSIPVLVLLAFNFYSFNNKYKDLKPSFKLFKLKYVKDIMGIGFNFFIIQIAAIILFSTDNIIITQLFSPEEVTPYNIAFKYFSIVTMGFSIIVTPYWSAITEAYTKKDFSWIKKSINTLLKLSIIFSLGAIVLIIFSNEFYFFWVGDLIQVPFTLSLFMGIYAIMRVFGLPFNHFINGTGKIKFQLYFAIFGAVMNIPLSIYFAKHLELGISGIMLATIACDFIGLIILPIQYNKIINNKAHGIWNR